MGQRLLQGKLVRLSARVRELSEELRVVEDQLSHLAEETDELSLRALVAETPAAEFEYREAKRHSDAMQRHREGLRNELADVERRINELLDRMKEPSA